MILSYILLMNTINPIVILDIFDIHPTFEQFKTKINEKSEDGQRIYNLEIKETDKLVIVYCDNFNPSNDVELWTKSIIFEKQTMKPIGSQFNNIVYNDDAIDELKKINWNYVEVEPCFEGTVLLVYNFENKWYISTRRCIDASKSIWIKGISYYDMFLQIGLDFATLNPNYCYQYVLVHYLNKNIVTYANLPKEYKVLVNTNIMEKYTLKNIPANGVAKIPIVNLNNALTFVKQMNDYDISQQLITNEGLIVKLYNKDKTFCKTYKLQTDLYKYISSIKPNISNTEQLYLELYQKNQLIDYLKYTSRYGGKIVNRIDTSFKTLSKEMLNLYHATRHKQNQEIYNKLRSGQKNALYELHGIYIKMRAEDLAKKQLFRSLSIFDVYHYLKRTSPEHLRQIYYERMQQFNSNQTDFLLKCNETYMQTKLMFNL